VNFISLPHIEFNLRPMNKPCLAHGCLVWSDVVSIQPDEDMAMASGLSHDDNVPIINSYELNYVVPRFKPSLRKSYDPQTPNYDQTPMC
jgi:hypothetical protein